MVWNQWRRTVGSPDVWDVIAYAEKEYGMKVSLITSGFAWDEERFEKLHKYEVHTAISIDGNRESNEVIRRKGQLRQSVERHEKTI